MFIRRPSRWALTHILVTLALLRYNSESKCYKLFVCECMYVADIYCTCSYGLIYWLAGESHCHCEQLSFLFSKIKGFISD